MNFPSGSFAAVNSAKNAPGKNNNSETNGFAASA